jgi:polyisoprenoid-binding protein YceI
MMNILLSRTSICVAAFALASFPPALAQAHPINTSRSTMKIHVGKAGLFSAFGHEHEISAPIAAGEIDASSRPRVEIQVKSGQMKVLDAQGPSADRARIEQTMLSPAVLDSKKYPYIRFRSTAFKKVEPKRWLVTGELTLHGQTHPVNVDVRGGDGEYRGSARLRQTQFGITPVKVGGGSVRVKDEIEINFDIFTR